MEHSIGLVQAKNIVALLARGEPAHRIVREIAKFGHLSPSKQQMKRCRTVNMLLMFLADAAIRATNKCIL